MSTITTHVLDTSRGRPAAEVHVTLARQDGRAWVDLAQGMTDADGRLAGSLENPLGHGIYRLTFDTGAYFAAQGRATFYPEVAVVFTVAPGEAHYHVPLLLSPYGYSTYRGS